MEGEDALARKGPVVRGCACCVIVDCAFMCEDGSVKEECHVCLLLMFFERSMLFYAFI
jgi:hypothetical protein